MVVKITSNKFPDARARVRDYLGLNFTVGFVGVSLSHQTLKLCQHIVALQVMYKKTCIVTLKQSV